MWHHCNIETNFSSVLVNTVATNATTTYVLSIEWWRVQTNNTHIADARNMFRAVKAQSLVHLGRRCLCDTERVQSMFIYIYIYVPWMQCVIYWWYILWKYVGYHRGTFKRGLCICICFKHMECEDMYTHILITTSYTTWPTAIRQFTDAYTPHNFWVTCFQHLTPISTHWGQDKMAAISETTFPWIKPFEI